MNVVDSPVSAGEQVQYESGVRMRYAVIALVAAVLLVVQAVIQYTGPQPTVSELTLDLITVHRRFPIDVIGSVLDCAGLISLAVMLVWLHSISRARSHQIRDFIRWLALIGAGLYGGLTIVYEAILASKANQFVHTNEGYLAAKALTSGSGFSLVSILAELGSLLLTVGFIWTSLNATRIGLLTRFVGYLGAFAGLLVIFPIGPPVPVVQGFWLLCMAMIIAGRWPNGNPPAWETGTAVSWTPLSPPRERPQRAPSRQRTSRKELAQSAARASAQEKAGAQGRTAAVGAPGAGEAGEETRPSPSTSAAKRKRKRRH